MHHKLTLTNASFKAVREHNGKIETLGEAIMPVAWGVDATAFENAVTEMERTGYGDFILLVIEEPEDREIEELMVRLEADSVKVEVVA